VHIFPSRLTTEGLSALGTGEHHEFWKNLKVVYDGFERTKKLETVKVDKDGKYFY
jgi:murein L,D-transpeptidase YafK